MPVGIRAESVWLRLRRLKLKHHELLSSFAFNFNLRRYMAVGMSEMQKEFYKKALQKDIEAGGVYAVGAPLL